MMIYQSVNLVRGIVLDIFIPAVVFVSLICMPLGFGILAIGAALGLALGTRLLVDSLFKPEEKGIEFDQEEYTNFYASLNKAETKKPHGFFKKTSAEQEKNDYLTTMILILQWIQKRAALFKLEVDHPICLFKSSVYD